MGTDTLYKLSVQGQRSQLQQKQQQGQGGQCTHLGERGHGQQGVVCDGVLPQVGRCQQRLDGAHLSFGATEEAPGVTGAHPHHPPGDKD